MTAKEYYISQALEIDFVQVVNNLSDDAKREFAAVTWSGALSEPVMIRSIMIRGKLCRVRSLIQTWWNTITYHERLHLTKIPDWLL